MYVPVHLWFRVGNAIIDILRTDGWVCEPIDDANIKSTNTIFDIMLPR